ncbi:hypothetical protein TSACC_21677 [Terrimicrobium sacchariphilum]|uniref:Uncharacterized protein n=1 Tax=Terrimicrobium sacchariphilum TaxID=690879 RepID=A0A146G8P9_TERSA|nr:hypothetical protein [Terrimicrobium sacchariphilum]GAT33264.1 hypothetical protein TSACC_21677 [Terrimicrobium sacchariphilum]
MLPLTIIHKEPNGREHEVLCDLSRDGDEIAARSLENVYGWEWNAKLEGWDRTREPIITEWQRMELSDADYGRAERAFNEQSLFMALQNRDFLKRTAAGGRERQENN